MVIDALNRSATSKTAKLVATSDETEEPKVEEAKPERFDLVKSPKSTTVGVGETAVCETEVTGGVAPYTYQWYFECDGTWNPLYDKNVKGLSGASTEKMTLTRDIAEVLNVKCVITDSAKNKITTATATITFEDKYPLQIATQPVTTTVKVNEDAKVSIETKGGSGDLTYQWQWDMSEKGGWTSMRDNNAWAGTSTPNLTVKSNTTASLLIRCVVVDNVKKTRVESESIRVIFE